MKALQLNKFGGIENFIMSEIEKPHTENGKILVKVKAIGINPIDYKTRQGNGVAGNFQLPAILGWDISGEVEEVSSDVVSFSKGDEVFGMVSFPNPGNAYAEYVLANAADLALKPAQITFAEAAAVPLAALTAYQSLTEHSGVLSGSKVLINGAAGGVGHLAVQIAKLFGAFVIGVSSKKNRNFLFDLGVEEYINYEAQSFENSVANLDAVVDCIGADAMLRAVKIIKPNGTLVILPSMYRNNNDVIEACKIANINVSWPTVRADGRQLSEIAKFLDKKEIIVNISQEFSFEDIPKAHKLIETGHVRGKLVALVK